jgi:hypothetical protein
MRKATRIVVALAVLTVFATAAPARADNVTVRFGISVGHYVPGTCMLSVPPGTSGTGVMDAAVTNGCIDGYEMDGAWLRCITIASEPICSDVDEDPLCCATHYWAIYEDLGAVAPHPLDDFTAGTTTHARLMGEVGVAHTELVLSFESWAKCLAYPVLCNPDL